MAAPIHLQPTAPLAERVLLPGDPGRALRLAQQLLDAPRMFNHHRGLWGYSGAALADGAPLTIQSTGMGGPSAAIVISELAALGARSLLRVGTCATLEGDRPLGALVAVREVICADGTSRALGAGDRATGDPDLLGRLCDRADLPAVVAVSTDVFYEERPGVEAGWARAGASVVEMEVATLFALAARHRLRAGAILIVTDRLLPARRRIVAEALALAEAQLGEAAMHVLTSDGSTGAARPAAPADRAASPPAVADHPATLQQSQPT